MSTIEEKSGMVILAIALLIVTGQTSAVNFSNILHQYALICGQSHLCGRTTFADDLDLPSIYHGPVFCPRCKCDSNCLERRDCCPDLMFPHPGLSCLNLTVFHPENVMNHALAHTECPPGTPEKLAKRCSGGYTSMEKLTMTPVSSNNSLVVYRNKFCAECFGEENAVPWSLNIDCQQMIDLNHLTSYDAILDTIEDNSCSMTYQYPNHQRHVSCDIQRKLKDFSKIEECNITGAWATYDSDIEWACQTVDQPYKYYKNIFCYMCNPGEYRTKSQIVDQCNQTALWSVFDESLQDMCDQTPLVPETYPFKNVYCYQCNRNTSNSDIFLDASIDIGSEKILSRLWTFRFRITSFNNLKVHTMGKAIMISTSKNSSWYDTAVTDKGKAVDLQKLLFMHFLHYGHQMYCNKTMSFNDARDTYIENIPACGCDVKCVQTSDCCTDFAMTSPITVLKHPPGFVISKCYNVTDTPYLLNSCQNRNTDASFAHIPITSSKSGLVYRNVYCFLCNEGRDLLPSTKFAGRDAHISLSQEMYEALDLKLECNFLIKYEDHYLLSELIKSIEHKVQIHGNNICMIRFPSYDFGNRLQANTVPACNITGQWDVYDPDVKWACENYIPDITHFFKNGINEYRNIFCKICNTNSTSKITIDTCSEKGHMTPINVTMATRCEMYPMVPSMSVYKNTFCAECYPQDNTRYMQVTGIYTEKDDCFDNIVEFTPMLASTYRKMFTFKALADNAVSDDTKDSNMSGRCQQDEVFDLKKVVCRPVHCFEGMYLTRNACRPFLPYATLLGYTMAVSVVVNFTPKNNDTIGEIMEPLQNVIKGLLSTNLKIGSEHIEYVSMYMHINQSCGSSLDPTRQRFLLHTSFVIDSMVDRLATEYKLVTMTSSNFSVPCLGIVCNVTFAYDKGALELPTTIHTTELEDSCFLVSHLQFSYTSEIYKLKYVSKFLTCQHVEIDEDQYESQDDNFYIDLLPNEPRLHFGEFRKTGSKRIQICLEDFEKMMASLVGTDEDSMEDIVKFVLQVISFVCVCLSVLGLLVTFLTYSFYSSLRTLPGKNNMCLIACLFFSQFFTQFGISQPKDRTLCAIFGLMIHYFWLATFFSTNVCSYHMFQVFVFPLNQIKNKKSEILTHLWYLCYCLGLPVLIIAMYVGISVSEEGNIGYGSDVKCFISSLPAFIASFIAPVFVICLANIVFFSVTVYHIAKVPHVSSNKSSRREVSVHIKLFLLTGISWIFQLIDSFVPVSVFSIIVNFVNASQGIFIFIAYCVNRRVRSFYRSSLSFRTSSAVITSSSGKRKSSKEASTDNQI